MVVEQLDNVVVAIEHGYVSSWSAIRVGTPMIGQTDEILHYFNLILLSCLFAKKENIIQEFSSLSCVCVLWEWWVASLMIMIAFYYETMEYK